MGGKEGREGEILVFRVTAPYSSDVLHVLHEWPLPPPPAVYPVKKGIKRKRMNTSVIGYIGRECSAVVSIRICQALESSALSCDAKDRTKDTRRSVREAVNENIMRESLALKIIFSKKTKSLPQYVGSLYLHLVVIVDKR